MPILVICTGCGARFNVSEKFAGKEGPCPKCKAKIKVPEPVEVKIAEPETFGGAKDSQGRLVLQPIERTETQLSTVAWVALVGGVLTSAVVAWVAGSLFRDSALWRGLGLVAVAFPAVIGAYAILRDSELEPYRGWQLYLRAGLCALAYAGLWGVFALLPDDWTTGEPWLWFLLAPPFVLVGGLTALGCFDLELATGALHYSFYLLVSVVLRWLVGMPLLWSAVETGLG